MSSQVGLLPKKTYIHYYRRFLKLAYELNWYNYRCFFVRKIKHDFKSK